MVHHVHVHRKDRSGFTLLELMFVIAIIGILALIVISAVGAARERGRIAGNQKFAASLNNIVGAYTVGSWQFEEGVGASTADSSGRNQTAILNNTSWSTDTVDSKGSKSSLSFNGVSSFVQIPFKVTSDNLPGYSYAMWFKWDGSASTDRRFLLESSPNYFMSATLTGLATPSLQIYVYLASGAVSVNGNAVIEPNKWYFVAVTWDKNAGAKNIRVYLNGKEDANGTIGPADPTVYSSIIIGSYRSANARWFSGLIDDVRIYEQALPRAEIQRMYADEVTKYVGVAK